MAVSINPPGGNRQLADLIGAGESGSWQGLGQDTTGKPVAYQLPDAMTPAAQQSDTLMQYQPFSADAHSSAEPKPASGIAQQQTPGDARVSAGMMHKVTGLRGQTHKNAAPPVEVPQAAAPPVARDVIAAAVPQAAPPPAVSPSPAKIAETIAGGDIHINYKPGSARLGARDKKQIDRMALKIETALKDHHGQGHVDVSLAAMTDSNGFKGKSVEYSEDQNQILGAHRVESVAAQLEKKLKADGVSSDKFSIDKDVGVGKQRMAKGTLSFKP